MEFLLQLFAELVINNDKKEIIEEEKSKMELAEATTDGETEHFFELMHFH